MNLPFLGLIKHDPMSITRQQVLDLCQLAEAGQAVIDAQRRVILGEVSESIIDKPTTAYAQAISACRLWWEKKPRRDHVNR